MSVYKCKICGEKTDWDSSYGRESFIVCPHCHDKLAKAIHKLRKSKCPDRLIATDIILQIGFAKEKRKQKKA